MAGYRKIIHYQTTNYPLYLLNNITDPLNYPIDPFDLTIESTGNMINTANLQALPPLDALQIQEVKSVNGVTVKSDVTYQYNDGTYSFLWNGHIDYADLALLVANTGLPVQTIIYTP